MTADALGGCVMRLVIVGMHNAALAVLAARHLAIFTEGIVGHFK
jgi:hypothetical protein